MPVSDHAVCFDLLRLLLNGHAVFGVDLELLLRREADGEEIVPGAIPHVIELCLREIESRGLTEQGICQYNRSEQYCVFC
jgi:GTPase-activating protein BEM2